MFKIPVLNITEDHKANLWRGMTYGRFPSMSKDKPLPTIEAPSLVPALASSPITFSAVEGENTAAAATPDKICMNER